MLSSRISFTTRHPILVASVATLLLAPAGCGGDDDGGGSATTATETPRNELAISSDAYTLQPGEEKYFCYTSRLPKDKATVVTAFTPTYGPGTHHILLAQTLAPEQDGFFECPVLFKTTWVPLYVGGVESTGVTLPEGAGVALHEGQQVLLQLHLQNTTASPITAKTAVAMALAAEGAETIPAGIFGVDDRKIAVPPNAKETTTETSCSTGREMDVYAMFGHMHKFGKRLEVTRTTDGADESLLDQVWSFADQPTTPVKFHLTAADTVKLRCTHANTTAKALAYGESSDNEMCSVVFYYTPFDGLAGCIDVGD